MKLWEGQREKKNFIAGIMFLIPNIIGFLIFTAGPVVLSLFMSFTNWSLKKSVVLEFVGLRNYIELFTDPNFWFYLYNTLYFMMGIPFAVAGSLFLANLLVDSMQMKRRNPRLLLAGIIAVVGVLTCSVLFLSGKKDLAVILAVPYIAGACGVLWGTMTFRTMFYVPSFASGVSTIILWTQIWNPYHGMANGIIQQAADFVGISVEVSKHFQWLQSTRSILGFLPLPSAFHNGGFGLGAREAMMIMGFWMGIGGNNMILYIASISNIPGELYEAADIDGANGISKFFHITIPSVAPTTFFILIMSVIGGLQGGFQQAKIMTGGGPSGTTTTIAYYIYTAGFEELRFGYASAVSWVLFAIVFTMTIINWKYGNKRMEAST